MKEKIISIDQGTSSTRSVLYDKKGQYIDSVQQEFDQLFPVKDGWSTIQIKFGKQLLILFLPLFKEMD